MNITNIGKINQINIDRSRQIVSEKLIGPFICPDCFNDINTKINYLPSYQYERYNIMIPRNTIEANTIILLIKLANEIIRTLVNNKVEIVDPQVTVFLSELPKKLPDNKKSPLGPRECNSGWSNGKEIVVYRKEECFKVILHELLHHYSLDTEERSNNCFNSWFSSSILRKGEGHILVSETITEVVAEIINIIVFSIINYNSSNDSNELSLDDYIFQNYLKETYYSLLVSARILDHYNCTCLGDIISDKGCSLLNQYNDYICSSKKVSQIVEEQTNMLAYYLFRSSILVSGTAPEFTITALNKEKLDICKRIDNAILDRMFIDKLNNQMFKLRSKKNKLDDGNSCKMTIISLYP